jgi:hypothetical protein
MQQGIVIFANENIFSGEYDGYGRMGGFDSGGSGFDLSDGSVYHKDCHKALGKPMDFAGKSQHADDQGWFFDNGDHDMASPLKDEAVKKSLAPVGKLKVADITLKRQAEAKAERVFHDKEKGVLEPKCPKCKFTTAFVVEKGTELKIRCPNRECNHLYGIPAQKQAALRKLYAQHPEQHSIFDDDEVNQDMAGIRSAKREIVTTLKELESYTNKKSADVEEQRYLDDEVKYLTEKLAKAKAALQEEEKLFGALDK